MHVSYVIGNSFTPPYIYIFIAWQSPIFDGAISTDPLFDVLNLGKGFWPYITERVLGVQLVKHSCYFTKTLICSHAVNINCERVILSAS